METRICECCGKEFIVKPSSKQKYCCRECANKSKPKGIKREKPCKEKILVKCAQCGKEEYVIYARSKTYVCCCRECLAEYNKVRYSQKVQCTCPVCGKNFEVKPSRLSRSEILYCSKTCEAVAKQTRYLGENNPNYGNKGEKNPLFRGYALTRSNHMLTEKFVHAPECPNKNRDSRIEEHRYVVWKNHDKFHDVFFIQSENFKIKSEVQVHHINRDHTDNSISNLIPLTKNNIENYTTK